MSNLTELQQRIWQINEDKGFHEDRPEGGQELSQWQGNKLMLIVSEAVEAHDEIRNGKPADMTYYPTESLFLKGPHKPEGVPSEIADIVIRCFDFAGTEGFDLGQIIEEKMRYNSTRPHKHGKAF